MQRIMKKFHLIIYILLAMSMTITVTSSVYAEWTSVTLPYVSENWWLSSVYFISKAEGWAVGGSAGGVILHYLNGFWSYVDLPNPYTSNWYFNDVHFTSSQEGWAVGGAGTEGIMFHYASGSWKDESLFGSGKIGVINGVYFTSPNDGWVVEDRAFLRHYQNGSWTLVYPEGFNSGWSLQDIQLTSSNEGWTVGFEAIPGGKRKVLLIHYYNGFWSYHPPPAGVGENWELRGMHFVSSNEGWAVGYDGPNTRGALLHYYYGTWSVIEPPEFNGSWDLFDVSFISSNEGWAVGKSWNNNGITQGILLKYVNGSWSFAPFPLQATPTLGGCIPKSIYFVSPNDGWIAGSCMWEGFLLKYSPDAKENISDPNTPVGPSSGGVYQTYSYDASGSSSNLGHSIQYLFDWGDGTNSGWLPVGMLAASKSWSSPGIFTIKVKARCASHTSIESNWSNSLSTNIEPEFISTPAIPWGPTTGIANLSYSYTSGGSSSNSGHTIQYLFDWGDGTNSGWLPIGTSSASHSWASSGTFVVKVQARCATNTSVVSNWSETFSVTITSCSTPGPPSNPSPSNGAMGISTSPTLSWSSCANTDSYDVYFGTSSNPPYVGNTTSTSYSQSGLSYNTLYYWKIVAKNNCGNSTSGPMWSFTTGSAPCATPGTPSNPTPQMGATGVSASPTLNWSSCSNTDSYDVYFGTSSPPPLVDNTTSTSYHRSGLNTNTTYYWQIVAKNNCGNSTPGPVWSFTTGTISTINITVTSPNGGENWKAGTTQTISWTYTGNPGKYVKIELLKGEAVNRTIAYRTYIGSGGSGSYSWRMFRFQTTGSDYKIRVTSFSNSSYTDTSDNNFTISK